MKHPIIVGTDLSETSDDALRRAEGLATRHSVPLTVVHAVSPFWSIGSQSEHTARLRQQVEARVTTVTGRPPGAYRVIVERGLAHAVLARLAIAEDALLVVGAHMHHGVGHALLKDVTERVVERARGPVFITRPGSNTGCVLVAIDRPFDRSEPLQAGIDEVAMTGSELTVLHCVETGFIHTLAADVINGGAYAQHPLGLVSPLTEARQALRAELARQHLAAQIFAVEGEAQLLIPRMAERLNARLIVVGSGHGKRSLDITNAVLRHAPCSVLVVDSASASALDRDAALSSDAPVRAAEDPTLAEHRP